MHFCRDSYPVAIKPSRVGNSSYWEIVRSRDALAIILSLDGRGEHRSGEAFVPDKWDASGTNISPFFKSNEAASRE